MLLRGEDKIKFHGSTTDWNEYKSLRNFAALVRRNKKAADNSTGLGVSEPEKMLLILIIILSNILQMYKTRTCRKLLRLINTIENVFDASDFVTVLKLTN